MRSHGLVCQTPVDIVLSIIRNIGKDDSAMMTARREGVAAFHALIKPMSQSTKGVNDIHWAEI